MINKRKTPVNTSAMKTKIKARRREMKNFGPASASATTRLTSDFSTLVSEMSRLGRAACGKTMMISSRAVIPPRP